MEESGGHQARWESEGERERGRQIDRVSSLEDVASRCLDQSLMDKCGVILPLILMLARNRCTVASLRVSASCSSQL